ncbi:hypothetical protein GQ43DRAFT_297277 [Delitschia confertaspora ATCC 74209]|uniref:Uncharacterized protein n=1 Tax=Delitschia confertaspora ATCC 74209 TaxID=1513339 RepID=A0A9P4JP57_9PLEO|nr:hypothetical protein GQ43DRAFT_297277 [Delitschia confertaspora ATCC 74209]
METLVRLLFPVPSIFFMDSGLALSVPKKSLSIVRQHLPQAVGSTMNCFFSISRKAPVLSSRPRSKVISGSKQQHSERVKPGDLASLSTVISTYRNSINVTPFATHKCSLERRVLTQAVGLLRFKFLPVECLYSIFNPLFDLSDWEVFLCMLICLPPHFLILPIVIFLRKCSKFQS